MTHKKRIIQTGCLALAALVAFSRTAIGQSYQWQSLTASDAIAAVQTFEGNPTLPVTVTEAPLPSPNGPDPTNGYELSAGGYDYDVCEFTANVFDRDDPLFSDRDNYYGQPYDPAALQQQAMSQQSAQAIAQDFMQAHYPDPSILTGPDVSTDLNTDSSFTASYTFRYYQDCGGGVRGPSLCSVTVDLVKGEVVLYTSSYFPVLVSITPSLTGDQAIAAAMNSLQITNGTPGQVTGMGITKPDPLGAEELTYAVTFIGQGPSDSFPEDYVAIVDANTGAVLDSDITSALQPSHHAKPPPYIKTQAFERLRARVARRMSAPGQPLSFLWGEHKVRLACPPLLIGGVPYVYVGYLCSSGHGGRARMGGHHRVTLSLAGQRATFSIGSARWTLNGGSREMSGPARNVSARCYIPLAAARVIDPALSYDAADHAVAYAAPIPGDSTGLAATAISPTPDAGANAGPRAGAIGPDLNGPEPRSSAAPNGRRQGR